MDLIQTIFELIDMRSFSNLWFWIALAVLWSSTSHWVLGVPWDMVQRARKEETGQGVQDFEDLVRIYTNRIVFIVDTSGMLIAGFLCFVLTVLLLLGFIYDVEFAQAVFLLAFPMTLVAILTASTARIIREEALAGEALYSRMRRHRTVTQIIGILSIFATAMWGMLQNMTAGVLG